MRIVLVLIIVLVVGYLQLKDADTKTETLQQFESNAQAYEDCQREAGEPADSDALRGMREQMAECAKLLKPR